MFMPKISYINNTGKLPLGFISWLLLLFMVACKTGHHKTDHPAYYNKVISTANTIFDGGDKDKAFLYVYSVYHAHPDAGPGDKYQEYNFITTYYQQQRNYRLANLYADSMLFVLAPFSKQDKYTQQYADANLLKGDILFDQGLYSQAYQYFYLGKRIAENKSDSCTYHTYLARFNERLAMISYKEGDFKNAILFYKKCNRFMQGCDNSFTYFYEKQGVLSNIAFSYERIGKPDSTLLYYNQCLVFLTSGLTLYPAKKDFIAMAKGVIYGNMADAYMMKGGYTLADSLYRTDIIINSQKGYYNQDALVTRLKLANLYMKMGRLKDAGAILTYTGGSPNLPDNDSKLRFLQTRVAYYKATGQSAAAVTDLEQYIRLKDSVQFSRNNMVGTNITNVFQQLQQQHDIQDFTDQNRLKNDLLIAAFALLLMAIIIILLIVKNSRAVKKYIAKVRLHSEEQRFTMLALEEGNRENARLANVLAHDLKNPIHAIATIVGLMLHDERPAEDKEMLGLVREAINNLTATINDVLLFRKGDGPGPLIGELTNLTALLQHSISLLQFRAKQKGQVIYFEDGGELVAKADSVQLWRVINNLLVNAIKFSPNDTSIRVAIKPVNEMLQISVADEGIGIPEAQREKVFELFTEARRRGTSGEETFGLGLYISKQIVEAHGGKIWFESAAGKGTVFYVLLPG
jgi:signal transduction histidine kinase